MSGKNELICQKCGSESHWIECENKQAMIECMHPDCGIGTHLFPLEFLEEKKILWGIGE